VIDFLELVILHSSSSVDPGVTIVGRCDPGFKEASTVRVGVDGR